MPKIRCLCNHLIDLGEIPSPNQWMIVSDKNYDELREEATQFADKIDAELLYSKMDMVVKCDKCGRLHIFWDGYDKPATVYLRDNDIPK